MQKIFSSQEKNDIDNLLDLGVPHTDQYKAMLKQHGRNYRALIDEIILQLGEGKIEVSCNATRGKADAILCKYKKS